MFSIKNFVESYEVKTSKTEHQVPVVNGIHLHSIYNPIREAEGLIDSFKEQLDKNPNVLILGVGFGYHIKALRNYLNKKYSTNYNIVVIDPNSDVFNDYVENMNKEELENVSSFIDDDIESLYRSEELVKFLVQRPVVIAHTASFNLYANFYKMFMSYKAPTGVYQFIDHINDNSFAEYLSNKTSKQPNIDLRTLAHEIQSKRKDMQKEDYLLLALNNMTNMNASEMNGSEQ